MDYMSEYKRWLDCSALSADEHAELAAVADNQEEIESRFFAPLSFGTAGLRGVLGVGLNRMNRFTVGQAAQAGKPDRIERSGRNGPRRCIAYDSRHFSAEFAKQSACIMAANGIQSLLFDELRPTPELSFAVRHYGCIAGINITASPQPEGVQRLQGLLGGRRTASSGRGRRGCQRNGKDRYLHRCKNCRLR